MTEKIVMNALIEGFDPEKLETAEQKREEAWQKIIGAYQNKKILTAQMVGIETLKQPDKEDPEKLVDVLCAVVEVDQVRGLIPIHQFGVSRKAEMRAFAGQEIAFMVLSYDKENEIFIASREEARKRMAEIWLNSGVKEGDIIPAVVRYVTPNLIRADIGGIEVKIPINEVRYGWIDNLVEEYPVGTHMLVKVLKIDASDPDNVKVEVSGKQAQENPFPNAVRKYRKGTETIGVVSGVTEYGVFVNLEDGVDSLARHLKHEPLAKGDKVLVKILDVDEEKEHFTTKIVRIIEKKK